MLVLFSAAGGIAYADSDADKQNAVLVTGASTGIGRKITEVLAGQGYSIYAGARKQSDLDALNEIENVQSINPGIDASKRSRIRLPRRRSMHCSPTSRCAVTWWYRMNKKRA